MNRKTVILTYETELIINRLGIRIKKARLRRNITVEDLATQVGISKGTLSAIERGAPTVSIAAYATVLSVLGMEHDLDYVAIDEEGKKKYREMNLVQRKRATKEK